MTQALDFYGNPETYCDMCGRRDSWGCGHSGSQRWYARRHYATAKHREGKCECVDYLGRKGLGIGLLPEAAHN